nr:uncharacterized mitochondrial protein AtMg00810-like [Tanacetum cinerariifolium]
MINPVLLARKESNTEPFVDEDLRKENECNDQGEEDNTNNTNRVNTVTSNINAASSSGVNAISTNISIDLSSNSNIPLLEDIGMLEDSHDDEDVLGAEADFHNLDSTFQVSPILTIRIHKDHPLEQVIRDLHSTPQTRRMKKNLEEHGLVGNVIPRTYHKDLQNCLFDCFLSQMEPKKVLQALKDPSWIEAMQEELLQFRHQDVWTLVDLPQGKKSYRLKIEEEVYVYQPPRFEDPNFPDKVYKVEKALYGLHQDPRAWILDVKKESTPMETSKPLLKDEDRKEVDVHMYRSMISSLMHLTSSRPDIMFAVCACARYQVTPKVLHLHTMKRIFRYLKGQPKLGLWYLKDSLFNLVAYTNSDYAGASLDRNSTIGGCQFLGCRLISWQCKKQTVVANSTTEAEYVAASSYCGQVL